MDIELNSGHLGEMDGESLLPFWKNQPFGSRPLFAESGHVFYPESVKRRVGFDVNGRFRSVIFDQWKLIWTPYQKAELLYEIYDVGSDLYETEDLLHPDRRKAEMLKALLADWVSQQRQKTKKTKPTQKDLEALKALGYINQEEIFC